MHAALKKAESPVELVKCKDRNHYTIIIQFVKQRRPAEQGVQGVRAEELQVSLGRSRHGWPCDGTIA